MMRLNILIQMVLKYMSSFWKGIYSKSDFMQDAIEQRVKANLDGLKITTEQLVNANGSHIEALAQLLI